MLKRSLSAILVMLVLLPISAESQSVFRLFSTPAERAELERRRQEMFRPGQAPTLPEPAEEPLFDLPLVEEAEPEDIIYRLGGTMLRSDGNYTVWINDLPINQENLPENIELLEPFSQGRLRIVSPDSGRSFEVKPGQVLNLTTGELFESYDFVEPPPRAEADGSVTEPEVDPDSLD